jgi:sugar phosphate isomerase/epimerase
MVATGSAGPRDLTGLECKTAVAKFLAKMKPAIAEAEAHGVTIAIQNHAMSLLNTPDSMRYLADLSPSPNLGIAFSPYHLPPDENLLAGLIEDIGPRLVHFYAWQHGQGSMQRMPKAQELEQMPGRGKLDFRPLLASLQKTAYTGAIEIFMQPVPCGDPILENTNRVTEEINHARDYLEQCLRSR